MESGTNIPIIIYFNGSIMKSAKEGMAFIYNEPIYFRISQTISFAKFKVVLYQGQKLVLLTTGQ